MSKSKYSNVKSKVYDHFKLTNKKRLNHQSSVPSFTPKLCRKSMKIAKNLEKSTERLQRSRNHKSIQRTNQRTKSPVSPSKKINDKILWGNLEKDLVECIETYNIKEPLVIKQEDFLNPHKTGQMEIELILQNLGMCASNLSYSFINQTGKAKEKLLLTKMVSILTPNQPITGINEGISFENILIFCAILSNIEVPYKNCVKKNPSPGNL